MATVQSAFDSLISPTAWTSISTQPFTQGNTTVSYSWEGSATKANITIPDLYHLNKLAKQDEKLAKILHKLRDHINVEIRFFEKPECKCCDCEDDD